MSSSGSVQAAGPVTGNGRSFGSFSEIANFLWSIADLLRGTYKQADYGKVILPMTVLRRLDCVLELTRLRFVVRSGLVSLGLLAATAAAASPRGCNEPLPLDPAIVTQQMHFRSFDGATQAGPMCSVSWKDEGGHSVSVLVYGPKALASLVGNAKSAKELAKHYAGESPKGAEPIPGVKNGFTVFDPKTRNRRVLVEHGGKPYLINVTGEAIPLDKLTPSLLP